MRRRTLGASVVDQAVSMASNLGVSVVAARLLTVREFGAFSVAYLLYAFFIGLLRAFVLEPALARPKQAITGADGVLRSAVAVGCCAAIPLGVFAVLSDTATRHPVGVMALLLPGLAAFDARRYLAFAAGEPKTALRTDVWWLMVMCAAMTAVVAVPRLQTPSLLVLAWGLSGCVVVVRWYLRSSAFRPGIAWIQDSWEFAWRQFVGFAGTSGVGYASMLVVGLFVGSEVVGVVRATQLLFGPLAVLYTGAFAFLIPSSPPNLPAARLLRLMLRVSGILIVVSVAVTVTLLVIPDELGQQVLGDTWVLARVAIVPAGVTAVAGSIRAGASLGFLVRRAPREMLRVQLLVLPFPVIAAVIGIRLGDPEGYMWGVAVLAVAAAAVCWRRVVPTVLVPSTVEPSTDTTEHATPLLLTIAPTSDPMPMLMPTAMARARESLPVPGWIHLNSTWADLIADAPPRRNQPRDAAIDATIDALPADSGPADSGMDRKGPRTSLTEAMNDQREVTLRDYGRVVWRRKWIVVGATVAAMAAALALSFLQDPIYSAEAQMLVQPRSSEALFQQDEALAVSNLDRAIQTEIQVLEGQLVRSRVQQDLGLAELPPEVSAASVASTDVVAVTVRSGDPDTATIVADAYVDAYISTRREQAIADLTAAQVQLQDAVDELQGQIDATDAASPQRQTLIDQQATFNARLDELDIEAALTSGGASVVESAELPDEPVEPQPISAAILAAIVGMMLGLGAAFLIDYLYDSLRQAEDVEAATGLSVLAVVPVEPPPDHRPIALSEPQEFAVEVYRGLRTSIQFLGLDKPLKVIQVTSSLPGEGKTTTASNLAVVLAQAGKDVALVDADLRKPRIHEIFQVPLRPGLTETLVATEAVEMAINHLGKLHVIAAGSLAPNPSEMLASTRFESLIRHLSERYDYVVIDSAPVLPVSDALALSRSVDGVLVVGQANRTSRRTLSEGLSRLEQVGSPVIGLVLNRASEKTSQGYGYGYSYSYQAPPAASGAAPTSHQRNAQTDEELQHGALGKRR